MTTELQTFHGGIDTNNYMEAMNRVFMSKWLNGRIDQRLDSLLAIYVNQIEPYYWRTYVLQNLNSLR
jgi:hypothetical protein